jgi:hypothetical protein
MLHIEIYYKIAWIAVPARIVCTRKKILIEVICVLNTLGGSFVLPRAS